jgi:hypothetical protein
MTPLPLDPLAQARCTTTTFGRSLISFSALLVGHDRSRGLERRETQSIDHVVTPQMPAVTAVIRSIATSGGRITLDCDTLIVASDDLGILIYTAEPDTEDAERLSLAIVLGIQALID